MYPYPYVPMEYLYPYNLATPATESVVYQSSSRTISRMYTPASGVGTILSAVPTPPPTSLAATARADGMTTPWDRDPETFAHPLLRRWGVCE